MKALTFTFLLIITTLSCQNRSVKIVQQQKSDTARIIEIALEEGTSIHRMPEASGLERNYKFGDSILLTSKVLPLNMLPSNLHSQRFKILTEEEICTIIRRDSNLDEVPNYLMITHLERSDTGYYVFVQSLSCRPFGGGGSLRLYFKKIGDSWIVVTRASSSIN
jgi:hypothetical protein